MKELIIKKNKEKIKNYFIFKLSEFFEKSQVSKNSKVDIFMILTNNNIEYEIEYRNSSNFIKTKFNKKGFENYLHNFSLDELYKKVYLEKTIDPALNEETLYLLKINMLDFFFIPDEIFLKLIDENEELREYISENIGISEEVIELLSMYSNNSYLLANLMSKINIKEDTVKALKNNNNYHINKEYSKSIHITSKEILFYLKDSKYPIYFKEDLIKNKNLIYEDLLEYKETIKEEIVIEKNKRKKMNNRETTLENILLANNLNLNNKDMNHYIKKELDNYDNLDLVKIDDLKKILKKIDKELSIFDTQIKIIKENKAFEYIVLNPNASILPISRLKNIIKGKEENEEFDDNNLIKKYNLFLLKLKEEIINKIILKGDLANIPIFYVKSKEIEFNLNEINNMLKKILEKEFNKIKEISIHDEIMYL